MISLYRFILLPSPHVALDVAVPAHASIEDVRSYCYQALSLCSPALTEHRQADDLRIIVGQQSYDAAQRFEDCVPHRHPALGLKWQNQARPSNKVVCLQTG